MMSMKQVGLIKKQVQLFRVRVKGSPVATLKYGLRAATF